MHAIGTKIPLGGVGTPAPYAANGKLPEGALCDLVVDLATLGGCCFPQVYSVVRDVEGDSGLLPVEPMDGAALAVDEGKKVLGADVAMGGSDVELDDDASIRKAPLENKEHCRRVGYTIDISIDLGNASHFDVHAHPRASVCGLKKCPAVVPTGFLPFQICMEQKRTDLTGSAAWPSGLATAWPSAGTAA